MAPDGMLSGRERRIRCVKRRLLRGGAVRCLQGKKDNRVVKRDGLEREEI